ncbi:MAG: hypothetical protein ACRENQ_07490, partial [Gemmatimonadaceae bacterium]
MRSFQYLSALVAVAFIVGCKGADGATGPQGAQGTQGTPGVQGPQGPAGTANVISGSDTATDADWSTGTTQIGFSGSNNSTSYGKPARYLDIPVTQLTDSVYNAGAVLVWMQADPVVNPNSLVQLPWDFVFLSATSEYHYDLALTSGNIRVLFFIQNLNDPTDFGNPLGVTQATRIFRWVIVPPPAASIVPSLHPENGPDATIAVLAAHG